MTGQTYTFISEFDYAVEELRTAYDLSMLLDSTILIIRTSRNLGNAYWGLGLYDKALDYYYISLDASNKVRVGSSSVTSANVQVNWTIGSDARIKKNISEDVEGLEFINLLRPVTYNYDVENQNRLTEAIDNSEWEGKFDIEKIRFSGFIAQEVDEAAKKSGYNFSGVDKTGKLLGLRYAEFTVPLVKAVQELNEKNNELQKTNEDLQRRIEALEKLLKK